MPIDHDNIVTREASLMPAESRWSRKARLSLFTGMMVFGLVVAGPNIANASGPSTLHSASNNNPATAEVIIPITLTKSADLRFGTVIPTGTAGTVVINTFGDRSGINVDLYTDASNPPGAAAFVATGQAGKTFTIDLPQSASINHGSTSMNVDLFTSLPSDGWVFSSGNFVIINVGATLNVNASQLDGVYSGTFEITVSYP